MSIQVCFAGAENVNDRDTAFVAGARNFLFTAWNYLQKASVSQDDFTRIARIMSGANITIMDSGLFTLLFGSKSGKVGRREIDRYFDSLVHFIRRMGKVTPVCVEADAQKIIGPEATWELRKRFREALPGVQQINVVHPEDGVEGLDRIIDFADYIGIPCVEMRRLDRSNAATQIRDLVYYIKARKPGIKIHLLGCTDLGILDSLRQDVTTADSTSWNAHRKFGYRDGIAPTPELERMVGEAVKSSQFLARYKVGESENRVKGYTAMYIGALEVLNELEGKVGPQVRGTPLVSP